MAHIYRLIFVLLSLFSGLSHADTCDALDAKLKVDGDAWVVAVNYNISHGQAPGYSGPSYLIQTEVVVVGVSNRKRIQWRYFVNGTQTLDYTAWSSCTLPPPGKCDWALGQTIFAFGTFYIERSKPMCNSGCQFVLKGDAGVASESKRLSATSPWWDLRTMGDFVGTNMECNGLEQTKTGVDVSTGVAPPNTLPPLDVCPAGKVGGTVNGVFVCVPPGETTGSGTGTKETVNPEGEKTKEVVTQATVCVATTCTITTTVTTTVTTSTGVVGTPTVKTTAETVGRGDYCKTHAVEVACGGSGTGTGSNGGGGGGDGDDGDGTFSASCGTAPVCSGDAVQCAQAEWAFKAACALTVKPPDSAESSAYTTAVAGAAGDKTADLPGNSTVNISSSSFDQTEFLGAASGLADLNVVVMGKAIALPFSILNVWLSRLGVILQAVTFLLCARIVTRG